MLENDTKTPEKTPENNTPIAPEKPVNTGFVDSENGGIDDFRKVLNIPLENPEEKKDAKTFEKADPFGEMLGGGDDGESGIEDLFDPEGEGMNELFEDSEALSEMCVELLDLGMNYASQAISMDWGEDEKYSIPDSRKRKLRKPLAKLLEKRAPKVSPELAFMVFVVALYSPQLIKAYGVRREKMNAQADEMDAQPMRVPGQGMPTPEPARPQPQPQGITPDEANEYDELIREMRSKGTVQKSNPNNEGPAEPKKRPGRPKGSRDTKPRKPRATTAKKAASSVKKGTGGTSQKKA